MPPRIHPPLAKLPATIPFVAPEHSERAMGQKFKARLGANEGNFGCSPLSIEAMAGAARNDVRNYPDPECFDLRHTLGDHIGIDMNNIVAGPGIDGLLGYIVRIFSSPGDTIVTSLGAYPTFNYHVAGNDRRLHTVPYVNDREDLIGLLDAAQKLRPAILYLSNPDNPMGTWWPQEKITEFVAALPDQTLLILDEAYGETARADTLPPIDLTQPNLLRMRTFSKAYGLAGLRCGYAFGHRDLIAPFEKIRDHFGVNVMAQKAAIAALADQSWLATTVGKIADARSRIAQIAVGLSLQPIDSATNFVTIDCGQDGAFALDVLNSLMNRGVFVRKPMAPELDRCIRVSAGRPEELDVFEHALSETLDELNQGPHPNKN